MIVHPDPATLAAGIAARLVSAIVEAQTARGIAHVALTGGGIGTACLAAVLSEPSAGAVDWSKVDIWWSDERFEPQGSDLRNETGARAALLDHIPLDPARVHPMPARGGPCGDDLQAAATAYAAEMASAAGGAPIPGIDLVMLGVGPDGHVASLFPGLSGVHQTDPVVAVLDSPKPPPTRLSWTLPVINSAARVWLVADGQAKASALGRALNAVPGTADLPAGLVHGQVETLALLDVAAAAEIRR